MTSNAENEKRGELAGRVDGRCWAEHTTEHDDLRRVAAIEFQPGLDCYKALCDAVDLDHEFSEMELKRYLFGDESAVLTNEYLAAGLCEWVLPPILSVPSPTFGGLISLETSASSTRGDLCRQHPQGHQNRANFLCSPPRPPRAR
jgi:hypothetical protein